MGLVKIKFNTERITEFTNQRAKAGGRENGFLHMPWCSLCCGAPGAQGKSGTSAWLCKNSLRWALRFPQKQVFTSVPVQRHGLGFWATEWLASGQYPHSKQTDSCYRNAGSQHVGFQFSNVELMGRSCSDSKAVSPRPPLKCKGLIFSLLLST